MNNRVLLVDDDPNVLAGFQRSLRNRFTLDTSTGVADALAKVQSRGPYAVVVADMQMPVMSGLDLLVKLEATAPDTIRMMLTGNADQKTAADAVNRGHVFRFLNKPCAPEAFISTLEAGIKQHALVTAERELLERTLNGTIRLLTEVLASLYPEAFGRSEKVRDLVRDYTKYFKCKESWALEAAALLAPIGYLTMPPAIIDKARAGQPLNSAEQALLERLPEIGGHLLNHVPRMESVAQIVRYQAKHYDGRGNPCDNVAGEKLPIGARVLKVLRDFAAIDAEMKDTAAVLDTLKQRPGTYDPRVLDSAFEFFDVRLQSSGPGQPVIRAQSLRELSVGQVLASNIETTDGLLVAAAGTELTTIILHRLRNFAELNAIKEPLYVCE